MGRVKDWMIEQQGYDPFMKIHKLPFVCANCFNIRIEGVTESHYCKLRVIFPTVKQSCKRYDGWI